MLKKVWEWIKVLIGPVVALLAMVFAYKALIKPGKVKKRRNWVVMDRQTIRVFSDDGPQSTDVRLPVNPETGEVVRPNEIAAVGVAEGGELRVEIKHSVIDRNSRRARDTR